MNQQRGRPPRRERPGRRDDDGPRRPRRQAPVAEGIHAFGIRAATEALETGSALRLIVDGGRGGEELSAAARARQVPIEVTDTESLDRMSGGIRHQGVAVEVRPPKTLGERDLASRDWPADAIVVVLDGVLDPHNVGASARVAEAAGASALVVRERRAAGITPAAVRASAGALLHLPVAVVANIPRALERLKDRGFTVVGLAGEAPARTDEQDPPDRPVALVVGGEERGLSRLTREACDVLVALPMRGKVGSLNASTALAAALYGFVLPARG
jgi:23S rRNA (guanosine2251-2'-O)-methyltransferase